MALCLLASACGAPSDTASAPSSSPTGLQSSEGDASAGVPENLAFTANLVGGGQLEGGDLAGKDVVLWFWAPW